MKSFKIFGDLRDDHGNKITEPTFIVARSWYKARKRLKKCNIGEPFYLRRGKIELPHLFVSQKIHPSDRY